MELKDFRVVLKAKASPLGCRACVFGENAKRGGQPSPCRIAVDAAFEQGLPPCGDGIVYKVKRLVAP